MRENKDKGMGYAWYELTLRSEMIFLFRTPLSLIFELDDSVVLFFVIAGNLVKLLVSTVPS